MEVASRSRRGLVGAQQGEGWTAMSAGGGLPLRNPLDVGPRAHVRHGAQIGIVFPREFEDPLDSGADFLEGREAGRFPGMQQGDVETEGRSENSRALAWFQGADGLLEFVHHMAGGKLPKVAALIVAVGVERESSASPAGDKAPDR